MADEIYSTQTRGATTAAIVLTTINLLLRATSNVGTTEGSAALSLRENLLRSTSTVGGTSAAAVIGPASPTLPLVLQVSAAGITNHARLTADGQALTLLDVVNRVLTLWGRNGCCVSDIEKCIQDDLLTCVHHGLQAMYLRANLLDYFNRTTIELTVAATENSVAFPQDVQKVLGNVRLQEDATPLDEIHSRAEFDQWLDLAYGGASRAPDAVVAYHLLKERRLEADSVLLTLLVTPSPSEETVFEADVATECPRYNWLHVSNATPLQIPHRYVESILLPLVLKTASGFRHFTRREMQPQIDEQYARAREALGLADPKTPAHAKADTSKAANPPPS